jgi:tetratricopeptide (TPR) repeat protein
MKLPARRVPKPNTNVISGSLNFPATPFVSDLQFMRSKRAVPYLLSSLLISALVVIGYSNTLNYPWHLDDTPNILQNNAIQITDFDPESLFRSIFSAAPFTGHFSRPLSYFTFALNWYFGGSNTTGYHIVNILIHVLASILLFLSIDLLFNCSSKLNRLYSKRTAQFIALFSSLLWALHPIQIQSVTYIVQRMTSMAGLFSIFSIYWFIKHYSADRASIRTTYLVFCFLSFICAICSKENPALLPLSFVLIHIAFFDEDRRQYTRIIKSALITLSIFITMISIYYLYSHKLFESLFSFLPSGSRPFSLYERVLTEPRILLFYISLILYPLPERFSIDHSIELSTSLFTPWETLPTILLLFIIFAVCLKYLKAAPLICFPVLFFLINHVIESSIIPLELIFEHRNYLPSLFLFVPFSVLIHKIIVTYRNRNKVILYAMVVFIPAVLILFCWSTYLRNTQWSSAEILWTDAAQKAPLNARPFSYLGKIYGWEKPKSQENLDKAVYYYKTAIDKMGPLKAFNEAIIGNIGGIYFNYEMYDQAKEYYQEAINSGSQFLPLRFGLAKVLIMKQEFRAAQDQLEQIIQNPDTKHVSRAYNLRGLIYLWQSDYQRAGEDFRNAIINTDEKTRYFYNIGVTFSLSGYPKQSEWFLKSVLKNTPNDITIMLSLIENAVRSNQVIKAQKYARNLLSVFPVDAVERALVDPGIERYRSAPIDYQLIAPIINRAISNRADTP